MKKNKKPLVSVIVNCHNGSIFLTDCIKSIINQTYTNWELIFWDNKSSDNSCEIIKKFKDKRIKIFKSKSYNTLYKSRNLAIDQCKGEYISFLDTDDMWTKNKLKEQVLEISKNKSIKMVYSNYYVYLYQKNKKFIKYKKKLPSGFIAQNALNNYKIGILTTLIHIDIFKKKKFNTTYNIIGDFDFFINLCLTNKVSSMQKPLATYRVHRNNFSIKKLDVYIYEMSKWIKVNSKKKIFKKYSFKNIWFFLFKIKIKYFFFKYLKVSLGV